MVIVNISETHSGRYLLRASLPLTVPVGQMLSPAYTLGEWRDRELSDQDDRAVGREHCAGDSGAGTMSFPLYEQKPESGSWQESPHP